MKSDASNSVPRASNANDAVWERLKLELLRFSWSEIFALFARRLILISLFSGALVFVLQFERNPQDRLFGVHWICMAVVQILLVTFFFRAKAERTKILLAFVATLSVFGWWAIWHLHNGSVTSESLTILLLLYLSLSSLPWPSNFSLSLAIVFILLCLCAQMMGGPLYGTLLAILFFTPLCVRHSARGCLSLKVKIFNHFMSLFGADTPQAEHLLRLCAWQISNLIDRSNALLCIKSDQAELVTQSAVLPANIDSTHLRGMTKLADQQQVGIGVLARQTLGPQYFTTLEDHFGEVPNYLLFLKLESILDEQERHIHLFAPATSVALLCGTNFLLRELSPLRASLQAVLSVQRSRFISSGMLSATQRSISEQEFELNEIIHFVNNATQDVSILCDGADQLLKKIGEQSQTGAVIEDLKQNLGRVEDTVTYLSREVSDIKLLRELIKSRPGEYREAVRIDSIVEGLRTYCDHRAFRKSESFEILNTTSEGATIKVQSRDYFETILRLLIREASSRVSRGGRIRVSFTQQDSTLIMRVEDTGVLNRSTQLEDRSPSLLSGDPEFFNAARRFFEEHKGTLIQAVSEGEYRTSVSCELPMITELKESARSSNQWILLVDDKTQVTSFYSRIAEALGFRHIAAISIAEAIKLLDQNGKPRLVITDLNLGAESGWTLIEELRRRYGQDLAVIVVSGETDHNVGNGRLETLGKIRCLTKPVGRSRLFAEIQDILAR